MQNLGRIIRDMRMKAGISQVEMSRAMGMRFPSRLCNIEHGQETPGKAFLKDFAALVELTPETLQLLLAYDSMTEESQRELGWLAKKLVAITQNIYTSVLLSNERLDTLYLNVKKANFK